METIRHLENNNIISISYKVFNQLSIIEVNTIVEALGTLGKDITVTKLKRFKPNEVDMTSYIHLFTLNDYSYYYRNEAIAVIPVNLKLNKTNLNKVINDLLEETSNNVMTDLTTFKNYLHSCNIPTYFIKEDSYHFTFKELLNDKIESYYNTCILSSYYNNELCKVSSNYEKIYNESITFNSIDIIDFYPDTVTEHPCNDSVLLYQTENDFFFYDRLLGAILIKPIK